MRPVLVTFLLAVASITACDDLAVPLGSIAITPVEATLVVGESQVFEVTVMNSFDARTEWAVSGGSMEATSPTTATFTAGTIPGVYEVSALHVASNAVARAVVVVTEAPTPTVTSVTIDEVDLGMVEGDTRSFTATVTTSYGAPTTTTWSSSDDEIVSIDQAGLATAHTAGTASVTVRSSFDPTKSDSVQVVVSPAPTPFVDSVAVDGGNRTLFLGSTATLSATVRAYFGASDEVAWTTDAPGVAVVASDGVVTAVGVGAATITATSTFDDSKSDSVTITVPQPIVTSVTIAGGDRELLIGTSVTLSAVVSAAFGASDEVVWTSSAPGVVSVSASGLISALTFGTADITATSSFDAEVRDSVTVSVPRPVVTGVGILGGNRSLAVGASLSLTALIDARFGATETVTWVSLDPSVATVDAQGVVTGLDEGIAEIRATSTYDLDKASSILVAVRDDLGVASLAAGASHSLAIRDDGSAWAWGSDAYGQAGSTVQSTWPGPGWIEEAPSSIQIAAGSQHSIALGADGTVWTWGRNHHGQLGIGSTSDAERPQRVEGLADVRLIAAGANHSLAVTADGTLHAWGSNGQGQLGDGTTIDRYAPIVVQGIGPVVDVAAGDAHSIALRVDGTVFGWGSNTSGQVGDGTQTTRLSPVLTASVSDAKSVAAGGTSSYSIKSDGTAVAWGSNLDGQLGDGTTVSKSSPTNVVGLEGVIAIEAGAYHAAAIVGPARSIYAWGWNSFGQVGAGIVGETVTIPVEVEVSSDWGQAHDVVAGDFHTLVLTDSGRMWASGRNAAYQLGNGYTVDAAEPRLIRRGLGGRTSDVSGGPFSAIATFTDARNDRAPLVWGSNSYNRLGLGTENSSYRYLTPTATNELLAIDTVVDVEVAYFEGFAVTADGDVWTWGATGCTPTNAATSFAQEEHRKQGVTNIVDVATLGFGGTVIALASDGSLWQWGGVIGCLPVKVAGLTNVVAISGAESSIWYPSHILALRVDGSVWAYGDNSYGQLGDGTFTNRDVFVRVDGLPPITTIAAGYGRSLVVATDGSVWGWGKASDGALGLGSESCSWGSYSTPQQVSGVQHLRSLALGMEHAVAVDEFGNLWSWGSGYAAGASNLSGRFCSPRLLSTSTAFVHAAASDDASFAIDVHGNVWTWGEGSYVLGDGTSTRRSEPRRVW